VIVRVEVTTPKEVYVWHNLMAVGGAQNAAARWRG